MRWIASALIGLGCGLLLFGIVQAQEKKADGAVAAGDGKGWMPTWPSGHGGISVDVRGNNNNVSAYQSINYTFNYYVKTGCCGQRTACVPYTCSVGGVPPVCGATVGGGPGVGVAVGGMDPLGGGQVGGTPGVIFAPQQGQPWSGVVPAVPLPLPMPLPGAGPAGPGAPPAAPLPPGPGGNRLDLEQVLDRAASLAGSTPVGLVLACTGALTLLVPVVRRRQPIDL